MHGPRLFPTLLLSALLASAVAPATRAQVPDLIVSLSSDDALPAGPVQDQELVFHAPGMPAHVAWPTQTLALLLGDLSGTQPLHSVLDEVDAVHLSSAGPTAAHALYVSTAVDEHGFHDGDVLRLNPLGLQAYLEESFFVAVTGASDGNVDIDAFHEDPDGTLVFSFADNESSAVLSGDDPGVIKDGALMTWSPGDALATIVFTESQVSAMVSAALGASTSTTDTTGVARDPATGELLFSVLSPTPDDASVFTTAGGGARVAGHEEATLGFTGSPELDGLTVAAWRFPSLVVSNGTPIAGEGVQFTLSDGDPGRPYLLLAALVDGPVVVPAEGWGGLVLQQGPLLQSMLSAAGSFVMLPDVAGGGAWDLTVPVNAVPVDVVVQAIAPGVPADASNPLVMELLQ